MVEVWPLSIMDGEAEAESVSAPFTVTLEELEVAVPPFESVTVTETE